MKTLLIDDIRNIAVDVTARTFQAGIVALQTSGPFDILYLDHDLGDPDPRKTGYYIMCFLEENPQYRPKEVIVVSSNPVGRERIQRVIDRIYGVKYE